MDCGKSATDQITIARIRTIRSRRMLVDALCHQARLRTVEGGEGGLVATGVFGRIECCIGGADEGGKVEANAAGDANAYGDADEVTTGGHGHVANLLANTFGNHHGAIAFSVWGHDQEFLAAVAAERIVGAKDFANLADDGFENFVSGLVSIGIVDGLEVVDVNHECSNWTRFAACTSEFLVHQQANGGLIKCAGESVVRSLMLEG